MRHELSGFFFGCCRISVMLKVPTAGEGNWAGSEPSVKKAKEFPGQAAPGEWAHPLQAGTYSARFFGAFQFWEEILCSENSCFTVFFHGSGFTGSQPPVNENEGRSRASRTRLLADLQRTRFPSEPSKHDPLLPRAIPPSPHWWVSKLLKFPSPDAPRPWPGLCLCSLMDCTRSPPGRARRQAEHLSGCIALLFLSITKAMILF